MPERRDVIDGLLRDGARIENPDLQLIETARQLATKGLIATSVREFVRCANPEDRDFPPSNRHCRGRVYVEEQLDEAGHDFKCPACERPVFPFRTRKKRYRELQIEVLHAGVQAFLGSRLPDAESVAPGRYRVRHDGEPVDVCVLELCENIETLAAGPGTLDPTLCVAIHSGAAESLPRPLRPSELVPLADLVCGKTTIAAAIERLVNDISTGGPDPALGDASAIGEPRFQPPRTILFRGVPHDCPGLTRQQTAFLRIALPHIETPLESLFGAEAVWEEAFTGTTSQRGRLSQLISRVNRKLCDCAPPLGVSFSLRSGENFITRTDPKAADTPRVAADNRLTKD